ncbi:hypothetical protein QFC20_004247 [Naganishia adeliensis]|uniref:Uncharacterized protein n=1 Tax=Naganishia adeliensis TaxID=92952 RepID=A0ACC2W1Y8_9TREE|nr:hypothetical protein QFC20_004247 [Naganishia adeliensis]
MPYVYPFSMDEDYDPSSQQSARPTGSFNRSGSVDPKTYNGNLEDGKALEQGLTMSMQSTPQDTSHAASEATPQSTATGGWMDMLKRLVGDTQALVVPAQPESNPMRIIDQQTEARKKQVEEVIATLVTVREGLHTVQIGGDDEPKVFAGIGEICTVLSDLMSRLEESVGESGVSSNDVRGSKASASAETATSTVNIGMKGTGGKTTKTHFTAAGSRTRIPNELRKTRPSMKVNGNTVALGCWTSMREGMIQICLGKSQLRVFGDWNRLWNEGKFAPVLKDDVNFVWMCEKKHKDQDGVDCTVYARPNSGILVYDDMLCAQFRYDARVGEIVDEEATEGAFARTTLRTVGRAGHYV